MDDMRRSLRSNKSSARVQAGRRSAEIKSERRDDLLYEVESYDPTLLPLARKWDHKIPAYPKNKSRFEYFLDMVEDDPDAAMELATKEAESYIKQLSRAQWEQEPEDDPYDYVDEFDDEDEEPEEDEIESFILYLEDVLSNKEIDMLNRVIKREGMSGRQLKCFYYSAKKKLTRNGSIWR